MFELEMFESLEKTSNYIIQKPEWRKDQTGDHGGWSTFKSMDGLKRRLLHAIMTEDTFVFAMGGMYYSSKYIINLKIGACIGFIYKSALA